MSEEKENPLVPEIPEEKKENCTKTKETKKKKYERHRCYSFTDNKCKDLEEYNTLKDCRYIIVGEETAPTTGKKHWQCYVQFENPVSFAQCKKRLPEGVHIEVSKGNAEQNKKYCSKEGNVLVEKGETKDQGERSDLEVCYDMIRKGKSLLEVADLHPIQFSKYHSAFKEYRKLVQQQRNKHFRKVEVEFVTGPTGCGKTRYAVESAEENDWYKIEGCEMKWWDGYENEKHLVIDEYANDVKITKMLNLLDGYQLRLPVKCSFTYAGWTKVIITSNMRLEE